MPNFDQFERLTRHGLVGTLAPAVVAAEMAAVYDDSRPGFAKGKKQPDLEEWIVRASDALHSLFSPSEIFTTSDNNAAGKDLYAVSANRHIELKSPGGKTDANVGVSAIAWALDDESGQLALIMTSGMRERREIWLATEDFVERDAAVHASKLTQMNRLLDYFGDTLQVGARVGPRLSHYVRSVAAGLTKLPEIEKAFQQANVAKPLLLVADWDRGLKVYEQDFNESEEIRVESLVGAKESARVSLKLRGEESMRTCLIYPHHKNSFRTAGSTVPASAWVKNACFHVWIE